MKDNSFQVLFLFPDMSLKKLLSSFYKLGLSITQFYKCLLRATLCDAMCWLTVEIRTAGSDKAR